MNHLAPPDPYGVLTEPATLTISRLLPGPIERVWAFLTDSDLRRKWLAAGVMELRPGAAFEYVWRNAELTDPPGKRPPGFGEEFRMGCHIVEVDPPRKLVITWGETESGEVAFLLDPQADGVLLTVVHRRLRDRNLMLNVSAGWHTHLNILVALSLGNTPAPYWDVWSRLRDEYDRRLPR
jgi:uncharacterized protein YndB with AHSA1/START domain